MSLELHLVNLNSALARFRLALSYGAQDHEIIIDGCIQRFEYCFELCWKSMREALAAEGLNANSPKDTFKKALSAEWISDEELWLRMLEDRNLTTHTYFIEMAERVYAHLSAYFQAIEGMYELLISKQNAS